jgi:hypothetical protein
MRHEADTAIEGQYLDPSYVVDGTPRDAKFGTATAAFDLLGRAVAGGRSEGAANADSTVPC